MNSWGMATLVYVLYITNYQIPSDHNVKFPYITTLSDNPNDFWSSISNNPVSSDYASVGHPETYVTFPPEWRIKITLIPTMRERLLWWRIDPYSTFRVSVNSKFRNFRQSCIYSTVGLINNIMLVNYLKTTLVLFTMSTFGTAIANGLEAPTIPSLPQNPQSVRLIRGLYPRLGCGEPNCNAPHVIHRWRR